MWVLLVVALFSVFFFILGRFSVRKKAEIPLSPVSVAETESKEKASATEPQAPEKVHAVTQGLPPEKQAEPEKLVQPDPAQLPLGDEASFTSWMLSHTPQTSPFLSWKWKLGQSLKQSGDIVSDRVLAAFLKTPRESFCREQNLGRAYEDIFMSIGYGVTISDPNVVCRMTETINPSPGHKVLEIGTGSGYQSAILSELSEHVYTVEIIKPLAEETDAIYRGLEERYPQYKNVHRKISDGYYGWEEAAPFDRIIVTCGIDHIPPPLLKQLAPDGIMVIPVGPRGNQTLLKVTRKLLSSGETVVEREDVYKGAMKVRFVPLTDSSGESHKGE